MAGNLFIYFVIDICIYRLASYVYIQAPTDFLSRLAAFEYIIIKFHEQLSVVHYDQNLTEVKIIISSYNNKQMLFKEQFPFQ